MTKSETWKDIAGFEGFYKVSDKGRIYSVERVNSRGSRCGGRIVKSTYDKGAYHHVNLYKNGKRKTRTVHRLVAETFLPNPNDLPQVNHRDEVKDNNNVENLEWCDSTYNNNYGTKIERLSKKVKAVNAKTGETITFNSTAEAERKGYSRGGVSAACRGVYNTIEGRLGGDRHLYKGFRWYYDVEEGNESK